MSTPSGIVRTSIELLRRRRSLSRRKRLLFYSLYCVFWLALLFCCGEIVARVKGYRPFAEPDSIINYRPGGARYFAKHPTLGFTHTPGEFRLDAQGKPFKITHLPDSLRITHPLNTYTPDARKPEVWVFGCSITHGWSLSDDETYPWLLQEKFPQYEIVNFGVDGYGTLQSLIQLREALARGRRPKIVILAYGSIHDERNTLTRNWRKFLPRYDPRDPLTHPYARLDAEGKLREFNGPVDYREFPLMRRSALMNLLDDTYDRFDARFSRSHDVSKALVREFYELCRANGVEFVVAGIYATGETSEMIEFCRGEGMKATDISVDLRIRGNNNLPYDPHPSALANRQYAEKLEAFLRSDVLKDSSAVEDR